MAFQVTDEVVEKARDAYHEERSSGIPRQGSSSLMRAAIEAIAPMIRNQVLEEAARVIEMRSLNKSGFGKADALSNADAIRATKTSA